MKNDLKKTEQNKNNDKNSKESSSMALWSTLCYLLGKNAT